MDRLMQMVAVMQEFGWTFEEYENQPQYVLDAIMAKLKTDHKEHELATKRSRHVR